MIRNNANANALEAIELYLKDNGHKKRFTGIRVVYDPDDGISNSCIEVKRDVDALEMTDSKKQLEIKNNGDNTQVVPVAKLRGAILRENEKID